MRQTLQPVTFILAALLAVSASTCQPASADGSSSLRLGDLKSFEVDQYNTAFGTERVPIEAEYPPILRTALNQETSLPKGSPADGVIHMYCVKWPECNDIKVNVTAGWDGPEVWSTVTKKYKFFSTWWFGNIVNPPEYLTRDIIKQLAVAYKQDQVKSVSLPQEIPNTTAVK